MGPSDANREEKLGVVSRSESKQRQLITNGDANPKINIADTRQAAQMFFLL